jgi:hypothetical protein
MQSEYPVIAKDAINILLYFSTTYLCELGFLALINIKKQKMGEASFHQLENACVLVFNSTVYRTFV